VSSPIKTAESFATASYKTAISRRNASRVARRLLDQGILSDLRVTSILDFGCGSGADVDFYRRAGFDARGFDVAPSFQKGDASERSYDFVTVVFVLNVLPSLDHRLSAISSASRFVRPSGYLFVATRSEAAVGAAARRSGWARFNDGWISNARKGTFQKGIARSELAGLLEAAGFQITSCSLRLGPDVTCLLGKKADVGGGLDDDRGVPASNNTNRSA
jgi:2-polyprenyl-3-methyl-5-hydroxy-6-metoxy-1,4-benzoquinol methylase